MYFWSFGIRGFVFSNICNDLIQWKNKSLWCSKNNRVNNLYFCPPYVFFGFYIFLPNCCTVLTACCPWIFPGHHAYSIGLQYYWTIIGVSTLLSSLLHNMDRIRVSNRDKQPPSVSLPAPSLTFRYLASPLVENI